MGVLRLAAGRPEDQKVDFDLSNQFKALGPEVGCVQRARNGLRLHERAFTARRQRGRQPDPDQRRHSDRLGEGGRPIPALLSDELHRSG